MAAYRDTGEIVEQILAAARMVETGRRGLARLEEELQCHPNIIGGTLDRTLGQKSPAWKLHSTGRLQRLHMAQGRNQAGMETWTCVVGMDSVQKTFVAYRPHALFGAWDSVDFVPITVCAADAYLARHISTADQKPPCNWALALEGGWGDMDTLMRALFHHFLMYEYAWHTK